MARLRSLTAVAIVSLLAAAPLACGPGRKAGPTGEAERPPPVTPVTPDPGAGGGSTSAGAGGGGGGGGASTVVAMVDPRPAARTAVKAKALSATVEKGLAWLVAHQLPSGAWGQGDEAATMGNGMAELRDVASLADTSMALLALLRAGHQPNRGAYRDQVNRGLEFVLAEVERADTDSLYVTATRGTRVQGKIGPYADTFAALLVLDEAKGRMRDSIANDRVDKAIAKIAKKVEKNQRPDGTFDGAGWAPVLSQALASKGMNRAAQNGVQVSQVVLDRLEQQAHAAVDLDTATFAVDGAAGVGLYGAAAASSGARESANTRADQAAKLKKARRDSGAMDSPDVPTKAAVKAAEAKAKEIDFAADQVEGALMQNMARPEFVSGFGNNGGEEYLSYLLVSESLAIKGGDKWTTWDERVTALVDGVQNDDGSWTGHHCITGRTFCTAAALLVLMGDRTPAPPAVIAT
jgi:hypothetical protein